MINFHNHEHFGHTNHIHGPKKFFLFLLAGISFVAFFALVFGFLVQYLWNFTIASIFNIPTITYLQAVGLTVLSRLLFGGCGPNHCKHGRFHRGLHHKLHATCNKNYSKFWKEEGKEALDSIIDDE